jgi:hypothetical protein
MFIQEHYLIDIMLNSQFTNDKFVRSDTLYYSFYDLNMQEYIHFEKLEPDAKVLNWRNMAGYVSFSNLPKYDPMNGISDFVLTSTTSVINGRNTTVIGFKPQFQDSLEIEYARRTRFWVDTGIKRFPIHLSYLLSKKPDEGFVYKMQLAGPDGKSVMVTSYEYQPAQLSDTLKQHL